MPKLLQKSIRSGKRQAAIMNLKNIARKEIESAMDKGVKPALVKSHELVVAGWKSNVGFAAKKYLRADSITIYVYPTGKDKKVWTYVDQGTKAHDISEKPGKGLWFEWGGKGSYEPKTLARPARTVAGGGYVKSGHLVRMKKVRHPGSEGRFFSEAIAKDSLPDFRRLIENAFRNISRKVQE